MVPGSRSTSTAWEFQSILELTQTKGNINKNSVKSEQNASHDAATHPGHVLPGAGLVVVDIDPLQLQVGLAGVGAGRVDPVLVRDDLPELGGGGQMVRYMVN